MTEQRYGMSVFEGEINVFRLNGCLHKKDLLDYFPKILPGSALSEKVFYCLNDKVRYDCINTITDLGASNKASVIAGGMQVLHGFTLFLQAKYLAGGERMYKGIVESQLVVIASVFHVIDNQGEILDYCNNSREIYQQLRKLKGLE